MKCGLAETRGFGPLAASSFSIAERKLFAKFRAIVRESS